MLILTRRTGESIVMVLADGTELVVRILGIHRGDDRVRLGVEAPDSVKVWRNEIWERICAEKRLAEAQAAEQAIQLQLPLDEEENDDKGTSADSNDSTEESK